MNTFGWRLLILLGVATGLLFIAGVTVTLLMVYEIDPDTVDPVKLRFVQVTNWIYVGFMFVILITGVVTTPYVNRFRKSNNYYEKNPKIAGLDRPHEIGKHTSLGS